MNQSQMRRNRLTGSRAADLMSGNYKTWARLAWDMRSEQHIIGHKSGVASLDWGVEHEPQVRAWVWERHPDWDIEPVELVPYHDASHPLFYEHCGCSPDGLIQPAQWGLECKAPYNPEVHLRYVRTRDFEEYIPQIQFSLWVTGWPAWLFVSGDPRVADAERYVEIPVYPDLRYHARIAELATEFLEHFTAREEFTPRRPAAATYHAMFGK